MAIRLTNSVFIHIPKTGGTWVTRVLQEMGLHRGEVGRAHAAPVELEAAPVFRRFPMWFTFVRHPLAWYQSYWSYRMKHGWHRPSPAENLPTLYRVTRLDADCRSDDFSQFVSNCLDRYPQGWVTHLFNHYTRGCTFVGRQERLREDLLLALMIAGEPLDPGLVRTYPPQNIAGGEEEFKSQTAYTPELARRVMQVEAEAVAKWNYPVEPTFKQIA